MERTSSSPIQFSEPASYDIEIVNIPVDPTNVPQHEYMTQKQPPVDLHDLIHIKVLSPARTLRCKDDFHAPQPEVEEVWLSSDSEGDIVHYDGAKEPEAQLLSIIDVVPKEEVLEWMPSSQESVIKSQTSTDSDSTSPIFIDQSSDVDQDFSSNQSLYLKKKEGSNYKAVKNPYLDKILYNNNKDFHFEIQKNVIVKPKISKHYQENPKIQKYYSVFKPKIQKDPQEIIRNEINSLVKSKTPSDSQIKPKIQIDSLTKPRVKFPSKSFKCDTCSKKFCTQVGLRRHLILHSAYNPYVCNICDTKYISKFHIERHLLTHKNKLPYSCIYCFNLFKFKYCLNNHLEKCHKIQIEKKYTCNFCKRIFNNKSAISSHIYMHLRNNENSNMKNNTKVSLLGQNSINNIQCSNAYLLVCQKCNQNFESKDAYFGHIFKMHTNFVCPKCGYKSSTYKQHQDHVLKQSKTCFRCDVCNKICKTRFSLQQHISKTHMPYKCNKCPRRYTNKSQLSRHSMKHKDNNKYICNICGLNCVTKTDFERHVVVHNSARPYICDTCKASFKSKYYLSTHIKRNHVKEISVKIMPFKCNQCTKEYYHQAHLIRHLEKHKHDLNGTNLNYDDNKSISKKSNQLNTAKKYTCLYCNQNYKSVHDLEEHLDQIHTDMICFQCNICAKTFKTSLNLKLHMKRHDFDQPYKCEICHRQFVYEHELKNHSHKHRNDSPYECKKCGLISTSFGEYKTHISTHSNICSIVCDFCGMKFKLKSYVYQHICKIHLKIM